MRALTICQPYAHLIAIGEKPIENRRWPTSYRGPLAIHAGRSRAWLDEEVVDWPDGDLAFGAIVATAMLVACLPKFNRHPWRERGGLFDHEHAQGPWCWVLEEVRALPEPIPAKGRQGLWIPEPALLAQIRAAGGDLTERRRRLLERAG
jgi:hypothetical protein